MAKSKAKAQTLVACDGRRRDEPMESEGYARTIKQPRVWPVRYRRRYWKACSNYDWVVFRPAKSRCRTDGVCPELARRAEAAEVLVEALDGIAKYGPDLFTRSKAGLALAEYERRLKE